MRFENFALVFTSWEEIPLRDGNVLYTSLSWGKSKMKVGKTEKETLIKKYNE